MLTTHKTAISHIAIANSPTPCLTSVCLEGIAAVHNLDISSDHSLSGNQAHEDDDLSRAPITTRSSKRFNLHIRSDIRIDNTPQYLVVGSDSGRLSIFQPVGNTKNSRSTSISITRRQSGQMDEVDEVDKSPHIPIKHIRSFGKVLDEIWRVLAVPRGIFVVGKKDMDYTSILFYDFACDKQ